MGNRQTSGRPHEQLDVWKEAMNLVETIYAFSAHFPSHEQYGLTGQIRRSAISVASNIAEGAARLEYGDIPAQMSLRIDEDLRQTDGVDECARQTGRPLMALLYPFPNPESRIPC